MDATLAKNLPCRSRDTNGFTHGRVKSGKPAAESNAGGNARGSDNETAMRLVNHASELIHQIYQREKVEDVVQWRDAVQFPA